MIKQVMTVGCCSLREPGQAFAGQATRCIELHPHVRDPFTSVEAIVPIGVNEDEVSDSHGALESKVHGEIDCCIAEIVAGGIDSVFSIEIRWRLTGGDENGIRADTDLSRIDHINAVFTDIVITRQTFRDTDPALQRTTGVEG